MSDLAAAAIAALERRIARLERRQAQSIAFSRSTNPPIDTGPVQTIQGQMDALSKRDSMPVLFHYGFSSAMPVGGDKVVGYLGADRSSGVVIATGHQTYRVTGLQTGEVMLYDMWGHKIVLGPDAVTVTGDLRVTGEVYRGYGSADQVSQGGHTHKENGTGGGTTNPPNAGT